ncbi:hypothetical protein BTVI_51705 [Pitangus sulphuratus]|nr:hypothetical protein BTVI_51705 [Pitangus sulphuratus]
MEEFLQRAQSKLEELEAIVQQESCDVVAITETWWDDSHDWSAAMGGTLQKGQTRPPNQDDEGDELFYKQLVDVSKLPDLVLVGNLNLLDVCWKLNTAEKRQSRRFLECMEDNFLLQLSVEPDGIHPRVMRELAEELSKPLSIIYQQSWLTRKVPDDRKLANVMPIHKKGCREDPGNSRRSFGNLERSQLTGNGELLEMVIFKKAKKEDPGNYRPVSLTSVSGRVMEKIILEDIEKYLEDNTVIGHSQHGFMTGKSCSSNLISFYSKD